MRRMKPRTHQGLESAINLVGDEGSTPTFRRRHYRGSRGPVENICSFLFQTGEVCPSQTP